MRLDWTMTDTHDAISPYFACIRAAWLGLRRVDSTDANTDRNPDNDPQRDGNQHAHPDAYAYSADCHTDDHADDHGDRHAHPHADCHANAIPDSNGIEYAGADDELCL